VPEPAAFLDGDCDLGMHWDWWRWDERSYIMSVACVHAC
jgi:hypothetical protein